MQWGGADRRKKMLLLGGGAGAGAVVVIIVVAVVLLTGGGGSLPSGPLGLVPDDARFVAVLDVKDLLAGDAPDEMVDDIEDSREDFLDDLGVSIDDLDTLILAYTEDGTLFVMGGSIDFEDVLDELDDADYDDDRYQGSEMWERRDQWPEAVAVLEDRGEVVAGHAEAVKTALKSLKRGSGSLLQDDRSEVRLALERAGKGWFAVAEDGCGNASTEVRQCEAVGQSISGANERSTVKVVQAYLFRDDGRAERERDVVEEHLEDTLPRRADIEDVSTDGAFVVVTITVDEDDWDEIIP